jgi:hypothetical protein
VPLNKKLIKSVYNETMKMETACSWEISVITYKNTWIVTLELHILTMKMEVVYSSETFVSA